MGGSEASALFLFINKFVNNRTNLYNKCMENYAKKQIKYLLFEEDITSKELAKC